MAKLSLVTVSAAILMTSLSLNSLAQNKEEAVIYQQPEVSYATVTNVAPIYRTISQQEPYQYCWYEPIAHKASHRRHRNRDKNRYRDRDTATPEIIGTLIGGAIGHAVGHKKRNKQIGAVLGGIIGGSIAHEIDNRRHRRNSNDSYRPQQASYREERRCETRYKTHSKEIIDGYQVSYRYQGQHYTTVMKEAPGDKIKVAISVKPV